MKKRGQITIFVIIGILLIAATFLFLILKTDLVTKIGGSKETNPSTFMEVCMKDKIAQTLITLGNQGGFMNNSLYKKFRFTGEIEYSNIPLLCYIDNYYEPCVNQKPMYLKQIRDEIKNELSPDMKNCFDSLTLSLQNQYESVDAKYSDFEVILEDERIIFDLDAKIVLTNTGETFSQNELQISYPTMFYSLAKVAQEIMNQEAEYCTFNSQGYMAFHPEYSIRSFLTSDSIMIYSVKHKRTEEQFRFAVRSCVIYPA